MPRSDAYHMNCKTVEAVSLAMSADASFDCEQFFLTYLLPKKVKNMFS